jgi:hypothetical protein
MKRYETLQGEHTWAFNIWPIAISPDLPPHHVQQLSRLITFRQLLYTSVAVDSVFYASVHKAGARSA